VAPVSYLFFAFQLPPLILLLLFNFGYAHLTTTTAATMEIIITTQRSQAQPQAKKDSAIDRSILVRCDRLDRWIAAIDRSAPA